MNIKHCTYCGKPSRPDATYCKRCGHKMADTSTPGTPHQPLQADKSAPGTINRPLQGRNSRPYKSLQKSAHLPAKLSTPPASPHRAGHYSGLHPEDQPYQSSFMAVLRPPIPVVLSPSPSSPPSHPNATWVPKSEQYVKEHLERADDIAQQEFGTGAQVIAPALPTSPLPASSHANAVWMPKAEREREGVHHQGDRKGDRAVASPRPAPISWPSSPSNPDLLAFPAFTPRKPRMQDRAVPILLTIACLCFLLATSLLAFLFLSKRHEPITKLTLAAMPNSVRVGDTFTLTGTGFGTDDPLSFSRDTNIPLLDGSHHTDSIGNFSVSIPVSSSWKVGPHTIHVADNAQQVAATTQMTIEPPSVAPPQLQLANSTLDFGAGDPGKVSQKTITLTNAGGGQLTWRASSDQNWLTVNPNKGTFYGKEAVELIVNRSTRPGTYSGHVTFTQQADQSAVGTITLQLSVTMSIKATPVPAANLVLSTASLSYTGSTAQNPTTQTITLQNSGGQPLNWSAAAVTGDGTPWLSISPNSGYLGVKASTLVIVNVRSQQLAVGSYSGTISFQGGANPQISVTLSVVAPANLALSQTSLNLQAAQGQQSFGQMTLSNSGGQPLDWTVNAGANWLSVSPGSGHLNPGGTENITVTANTSTLAVNSYQAGLTFNYGASHQQAVVKLTVIQPPMAGISVQPAALVFNTTQGINPPAQSFTITNAGNATLNWATSEDANGATYAATSSSSSTNSLAPAKNVTITVTPKVASAGAGTITALITVFDSDKGSTVPKQQVAVTINIASAAIITVSPGNMVFNEGSGVTSEEELLTIDNTGSATLNWSLAQGSQTPATWLSFDTPGGTIPPGGTFTVNVTCDSSQLTSGTYTATLVVSDTDPNSPVLSQTVTVTLVVS